MRIYTQDERLIIKNENVSDEKEVYNPTRANEPSWKTDRELRNQNRRHGYEN